MEPFVIADDRAARCVPLIQEILPGVTLHELACNITLSSGALPFRRKVT